ncbi:DUF1189 domain-containing protein [Bacillus toyonensis]|uniref:DUF1189 family protein n=1 Tax=Bacillus toyonensis TaxID=155322 RepID=UPI000BFC09BC|nr:DUF1189 family protein [Bacillus toyonensis]MDT3496105.1 DUF1189 domain-containing protein [Bacillus toyonensis]PHD42101.1 hypothetical protein COF67_29135 [Bacillus toyonensis]
MNFIDQFMASLGFQFKKIATFRSQSVWKSIFYMVMLILLTGVIVSTFKLSNSGSISKQLSSLPDNYSISTNGATPLKETLAIPLPQVDTILIVGATEPPEGATQGLKNIIGLGEAKWSFGRVGYPAKQFDYASFPFFNESKALSKNKLLQLSEEIDETITMFSPLYQYVRVLLDLIVHTVLISLLALAGRSFKKMLSITYKEAWIITSFGITAPILVRTLIELLGITIPSLTILYWMVVAFFSILTIRHITIAAQN